MPLTENEIEDAVQEEMYLTVGRKTTVCCLTLKNGFEIIGSSGCVNPYDYDIEVGKKYARKRAIDKVWELMGFMQQVDDSRQLERLKTLQQEAAQAGMYAGSGIDSDTAAEANLNRQK